MIIVEICEEMNSKTNGAIDTQVRVVHSASTLFFFTSNYAFDENERFVKKGRNQMKRDGRKRKRERERDGRREARKHETEARQKR